MTNGEINPNHETQSVVPWSASVIRLLERRQGFGIRHSSFGIFIT
jgi:hypothetical protein